MKLAARPIIIFLLAFSAIVLGFAVLIRLPVWRFDLSAAQVFVFPFVLLLFSRLAICGVRVPKAVFLLSMLFAVVGVGFAYTYQGEVGKSFLIARLADDSLEVESRIFRENINREFERESSVRGVRYYRSFGSWREVQRYLAENSEIGAAVWGSNKWVNISFPGAASLRLGERATVKILDPRLREMRLIASVPVIGLSFQPERWTSAFIAALLEVVVPQRAAEKMELTSRRELSLKNAGLLASTWSSFAHRAFPWWLLGNEYLLDAISGNELETGKLGCALDAYRTASGFLHRIDDNPELFGALQNNLGLALLIGAGERPGDERKGLDRLRFAGSARARSSPYAMRNRASRIARENIKRYRGAPQRERKRKRGKGR